jgi:transposase-like protein
VVGKQKNPVYSEEFRREAVRLATSEGRNPGEVARELGVSGQTLRTWIRAEQAEAGERETAVGGSGLTRDERAELRELRKRVKQQEEVITILKKATAFFANDPR